MPCYHPMQAFFVYDSQGGRSVSFSNQSARAFVKGQKIVKSEDCFQIPCGKCVGCRLERSRQWAVRCMHEAKCYEKNCFVTLTYDDEHLPKDRSLDVRDFQLFFKRLRKKFGEGIRFYHCGEYGEKMGRPHYHACIFNFDFSDKKFWKLIDGMKVYISEQLQELWGKGFCTIGEVTFESAAYVARYCMKKIDGALKEDHYRYVDPESGEFFMRRPEYTTMSRRPGIGSAWYDRYKDDWYAYDYLIVNGRKCKPSRYYDLRYKLSDPIGFEQLQARRKERAEKKADDCTNDRLLVRERCQEKRLKRLVRQMEKEVI